RRGRTAGAGGRAPDGADRRRCARDARVTAVETDGDVERAAAVAHAVEVAERLPVGARDDVARQAHAVAPQVRVDERLECAPARAPLVPDARTGPPVGALPRGRGAARRRHATAGGVRP